MPDDRFAYGGQAVIEGVMIRGRKGYALACRLADGSIAVEKHPWEPLSTRNWFVGLPIIRGTPALIEALVIGYRSLMSSADHAAKSEGIKPPSTFQYVLSIAFALAVVIVGFVLAPSALVHRVHGGWFTNNLIEGGIRALFFVIFIRLAAMMPDMRRVFRYHGAEHKVINAYEATGEYRGEAVNSYGTLHQRCGTSFIFTVLVVGILVHFLVGWPSFWWRLGSRLVLLPLVAGLSYEVIRAAGKHKDSRVLGIMVAPGMWLQKITTQPPTPDMIEVAVAALEGALELDGVRGEEAKRREGEEADTV